MLKSLRRKAVRRGPEIQVWIQTAKPLNEDGRREWRASMLAAHREGKAQFVLNLLGRTTHVILSRDLLLFSKNALL